MGPVHSVFDNSLHFSGYFLNDPTTIFEYIIYAEPGENHYT